MPEKIIIEFSDVYEEAKSLSEFKASISGQPNLVIDDAYKVQFEQIFFRDAVNDIRNNYMGSVDTKFFDDTVIYELTKELDDNGFKSASGMIQKAMAEYLLYSWYKNLGQLELAQLSYADYQNTGREIKTTSSSVWFVKPTSRPWF